MKDMFHHAVDFNQAIGSWDVSSVTNMSGMFYHAFNFNQYIGDWNVSNVIYMNLMFSESFSFNQDIRSWDVSNVKWMMAMFALSHVFNQDIGGWDVDQVINMESMFFYASNFNNDISMWCVEKISSYPGGFSYSCPLKPEYHPDWGKECDTTVFVQVIKPEKDIIIFPNPCNNRLNLRIPKLEVYELTIYNNHYQVVYKTKHLNEEIDVSNLETGLYFLKVITSKDSYQQKFIKK